MNFFQGKNIYIHVYILCYATMKEKYETIISHNVPHALQVYWFPYWWALHWESFSFCL